LIVFDMTHVTPAGVEEPEPEPDHEDEAAEDVAAVIASHAAVGVSSPSSGQSSHGYLEDDLALVQLDFMQSSPEIILAMWARLGLQCPRLYELDEHATVVDLFMMHGQAIADRVLFTPTLEGESVGWEVSLWSLTGSGDTIIFVPIPEHPGLPTSPGHEDGSPTSPLVNWSILSGERSPAMSASLFPIGEYAPAVPWTWSFGDVGAWGASSYVTAAVSQVSTEEADGSDHQVYEGLDVAVTALAQVDHAAVTPLAPSELEERWRAARGALHDGVQTMQYEPTSPMSVEADAALPLVPPPVPPTAIIQAWPKSAVRSKRSHAEVEIVEVVSDTEEEDEVIAEVGPASVEGNGEVVMISDDENNGSTGGRTSIVSCRIRQFYKQVDH
jgi:hypothetical protein